MRGGVLVPTQDLDETASVVIALVSWQDLAAGDEIHPPRLLDSTCVRTGYRRLGGQYVLHVIVQASWPSLLAYPELLVRPSVPESATRSRGIPRLPRLAGVF